ncbi:MAG: FAD-linked oxidase C-terminal domain-containing protein [Phycisphaerales bacterium]|jgi:FAD/FMN-containing dehydrogenase/Fe-S oxidoreductase|nr:FAD-linked oxidase C-terminal domain-containing protein [Phycisphaerales bacterium]
MELPVVDVDRRPTRQDIDELQRAVDGEVCFDRHHRMLYATDASMYQVEPFGVVVPATTQDVARTVAWCSRHGLPVLPRGGGTSLAGQTVNRAVVVDCSKHLRSVGEIDLHAATVQVEPGAVLDRVQERAAAAGLMFGPEVSTSTHATLGGMISNRSAGLHSLRWGMTDAHVQALDVILADGAEVRFERGAASRSARVADLTQQVVEIVKPLANEIDARYPKTRRNVGGYALDRVLADLRGCEEDSLHGMDLSALLAGSEGTLGFIVGARLGLVPKPARTVLAVLAFEDVQAALRMLPDVLAAEPTAVELLDHTVIGSARAHETYASLTSMLPDLPDGQAGAVLYVDWSATDDREAERLAHRVRSMLDVPMRICLDEREQADLWRLRKVGLGLILSGEGSMQPVGGLEDCAVPPERLGEFQQAFDSMLAKHGCAATYYAHASVGLLHIRPRIDLGSQGGRDLLKQLGQEATRLVRRFGGTISGEHGDGRIRAEMVNAFYGPKLVEAFRKIKNVFDPDGRFNPGIIASVPRIPTPGMTDNLRVGIGRSLPPAVERATAFSWDPSLTAAAAACNGNGYCRRTSGGAMCPSYRATLDERHSTRGRGNALRLAMTGQLGPSGDAAWNDPETMATLDLCLGCKACRYECPAAVDMAALKSEYLAQSYRSGNGPSLRTRLKAHVRRINRLGSMLHPMSTLLVQRGPTSWILKKMLGVAADRTLPGFGRSLGTWHAKRTDVNAGAPVVLLYPDCFTMWSEPGIGHDAIRLLEAFGYRVVIPDVGCCGRTLISAGLLDQASRTIGASAAALAAAVSRNDAVAVVAVEPSCATALQQEWVELRTSMRRDQMGTLARMADTVEGFIASNWETHPMRPTFREHTEAIAIHQHCHQKHRSELTAEFLRRCGWPEATMHDTGCCGMAGAFGYEARHGDLSRAIAQQSLTALVEAGTTIAAGGTSCRHQLADAMSRSSTHPLSLATRALAGR